MSRQSFYQWLRIAFKDAGRALHFAISPWSDSVSIKINQVDLVNAVSAQSEDIADAFASIRKLSEELTRLNARIVEQDSNIRQLLSAKELAQRELIEQCDLQGEGVNPKDGA